jgi:mevalonate kinase
MKAIAPGKLILSGEHSVVYGKPSLAMAIDLCAESVVSPRDGTDIAFELPDYAHRESVTLLALRQFHRRLAKNYREFLEGRLKVRDILSKPVDLFQFAFITILDGLHLKLQDGLHLEMKSAIPIGCGLGSSAATVLSTLRAIGYFFRVEFRPDWYLEYSLEAERLQHGRPSGVDSYISLHGGCALFRQGEATPVPLPRAPIWLAHTGAPETTTGECVEAVRRTFAESSIWSEFEHVTLGMEAAVRARDDEAVRGWIRENQRLLERIGVVPPSVAQFVRDLEAADGSAKICGAGAVRGEAGGIVMVSAPEPPKDLCDRYGYRLLTVRGDPLGARIV